MGLSQNLFFKIDIEALGMEKFRKMRREVMGLQQAGRKAEQGMNRVGSKTESASKSADNANENFGKMFGIGMNLMFMGMALQQIFGRLAGSMMKLTGVSQTFGAAAKSVLLPFFMAISPLLMKIAFLLMKLPKPVKMAIGAMVALAAVFGTLLFFGAQLFLLTTQLSISFLAMASAIGVVAFNLFALFTLIFSVVYIFERFGAAAGVAASILGGALLVSIMSSTGAIKLLGLAMAKATGSTAAMTVSMFGLNFSMMSVLMTAGAIAATILILSKVFKKFGPVVGALATVLAAGLLAAISPIAAVFVAIFGAIKTVNSAFKKFGNVIGTIATLIVAGIALFLAPIIGLPVAVGIALAAVIAWFWNMRDEIGSAIGGAVDFVVGGVKKMWRKGKEFVSKLLDFILNLPSKIKNGLTDLGTAMLELGKKIINGLVDGIETVGNSLKNAIYNAFPSWLTGIVKGAASLSADVLSHVTDVLKPNDFILTSGGKMIKPHKNDTIIGTKNPGQLGGGGGQVTVNINDPVMKEDVDVERVVDEVEERVNRDTRGRSGLGN